MTDVTTTRYDRLQVPRDASALYADITEACSRLGQTFDALGQRLDARTRVKGAAKDVKGAARDATHKVGSTGRSHPAITVGSGIAVLAVATGAFLAWRRWGR